MSMVLNKIRRQAKREDGQLLILPSDSDSEEVGALSDPTQGLSSDAKGKDYNRDEQEEKEKAGKAQLEKIEETTRTVKR